MPWALDDVQTEHTPLSTTGGRTWPAARRLAAYLAAAADGLGLNRPGLRVLELGAGTGWLGCTVALNLPAAELVLLTEQEGGLEWLRSQVELQRARGLRLGNVRVQACNWLQFASAPDGRASSAAQAQQLEQPQRSSASLPGGAAPAAQQPTTGGAQEQQEQQGGRAADAAAGPVQQQELDLQGTEWDLIIGSDLVYNEIGSHYLPRVIAALAGAHTQIFYCHTKHRYDLLDQELLEQLEACGLACEEVWEPGTPPPPQSPPPCFPPEDLFPEQRIAVFRISTAGHPGGGSA